MTQSVGVCIDSLVTDLWLSVTVCRVFEQKFGLAWKDAIRSYLLDDDTHEALLGQNPTFKSSLVNASNGNALDISVPYATLALEMKPSLVSELRRYFPWERVQNQTQHVLGRTFLLDAYVVVDYDRRQFSVSQAVFPAEASSSATVSDPSA